MANRVVIGAFDGTYVLRVSKPGYNVLSTGLTPEQISFDSRWSETGNEFASGQVASARSADATVMFGTSFAKPPIVIPRYAVAGNEYSGPTEESIADVSSLVEGRLIVSTDRFVFHRVRGPATGVWLYYSIYINFFP